MLRKLTYIAVAVFALLPMMVTSAQDATIRDGERILAWVAPAAAPGQQSANAAGEVVYFNSDGSTETVLALPQGTTRVVPCGDSATSQDGSMFTFMTTATAGGVERGNIYMVRGASSDLEVIDNDIDPISCIGSAGFEFSPDSAIYAYIDYSDNFVQQLSPEGIFRIFDAATNTVLATFENATAFDLGAGTASYIGFFKNEDNEATEVGIFVWDGSNDREVATLRAEEDCYYNSGEVQTLASGQLLAILGYRCQPSGSAPINNWQLYLVDPTNRASQLEASGLTGANGAAGYFVLSETNEIYSYPDNNIIAFTVPDGLSNRSAQLRVASIDDLANSTVIIERAGQFETRAVNPYTVINGSAVSSPDGRYVAVVTNSPNNDAVLNVIDLASPDLPPVTIPAGDTGFTITNMTFSPDSTKLYFVAGGDNGRNNSLFELNLATGSDFRVDRGRFAQGALSPDATRLAMMNYVEFDPDEPVYLTLEIIDIASGAKTMIFEGGEVDDVEKELLSQSFAYPLSWRAP